MVLFLKRHFLMVRQKKLSPELQLRFLKRLSRLLTNGYPFIASLERIQWDKQLIRTAKQIKLALKKGETIDQAFESAQFHSSITAYLYFVKDRGDIQSSIDKCIHMYEDRIHYTKKFQQIARYPLILLVIFSILLYFINQSVLPSFVELFQTSEAASSTITFSMLVIDLLGTLIIVLGSACIIVFIIWHVNKRKVRIETQMKLYNLIPVYRKILTLQTSFQFATHLSTLLDTGMSIKDILMNMSKQDRLPIIAHYSSLIIKELSKGLHIEQLLSELTFFDVQLAAIFQKNVDNEALAKDLAIYAELLTEELHRRVIQMITLIQPLFFILLACFVVFIYMTLLWPMFQLIKTI